MNVDICDFLEDEKETWGRVSDEIWSYAELKFEEFKSSDLLARTLSDNGFRIEWSIGGIETAFTASYENGEDGPAVGFLGEYDALPGVRKEGKGNGHGCGHHLLGTASMAAAIALRRGMVDRGIPGKVVFFGCPAEEGGSGKAFMARAGAFLGVDAALTWHPGVSNTVCTVSTLGNIQARVRFHGKSAHAAAAPHLGRSALDSVEIMNVGCNYLREHMPEGAKLHYAVTDTGGVSPNVVQAEAEAVYLLRTKDDSELEELFERLKDIAEGSARMNGTKCEIRFEKACSTFLPNRVLSKLLARTMDSEIAPEYTKEDIEELAPYREGVTSQDILSSLYASGDIGGASPAEILRRLDGVAMNAEIQPYAEHPSVTLPGSTDVGDVSKVVPTAQFGASCYCLGTVAHSWQMTEQGKTSAAKKGMLFASKVLAKAGLELVTDKDTLQAAKREFSERGISYKSLIPDTVEPPRGSGLLPSRG